MSERDLPTCVTLVCTVKVDGVTEDDIRNALEPIGVKLSTWVEGDIVATTAMVEKAVRTLREGLQSLEEVSSKV